MLDDAGYGDASDLIAALEWAVDNGIQVANLSLGWDLYRFRTQTCKQISVGAVWPFSPAVVKPAYEVSSPARVATWQGSK